MDILTFNVLIFGFIFLFVLNKKIGDFFIWFLHLILKKNYYKIYKFKYKRH